MSILNRMLNSGHLDDSALAAIWSTGAAAGRTPSNAHLDSCAQCRARYAAFVTWLEDLREDAHTEAEEAFPSERLAAQQAQILRRLEALERPARVIAFPRLNRPAPVTAGGPQRWIAAAAAAGLLVGVVAGQMFDLRQALRPSQTIESDARLGASATSAWPIGIQTIWTDEDLFYDEAPRSSAGLLPALDSMTPRARDLDFPR